MEARRSRLLADLRRNGVTDDRVIAALQNIPRDLFVEPLFKAQAWEDTALPIPRGQTISQPFVVGVMTQALAVGDRMKVLEIGTGSGYQAAILSRLCRRLYTMERHRPLLVEAEKRFRTLRLHNITSMVADGARGWPEQAPFERIMVTAAAHDIPPKLIEQLAIGGIMVLPVGEAHSQEQDLLKVTRTEQGIHIDHLGPVRFVPLVEGIAED